ncbi:MAG: DNA-binding protein [Candidatus Magnetomorum sp.]|nr:DNA-binding protein [Candidatus Magnetomorum sp.]
MNQNAANLRNIKNLPDDIKTIADIIGYENAYKLCKYFGGGCIYIVQLKTIDRYLRNEKIRQAFNGANISELSFKHGISKKQIYRIVKGKS